MREAIIKFWPEALEINTRRQTHSESLRNFLSVPQHLQIEINEEQRQQYSFSRARESSYSRLNASSHSAPRVAGR